MVAGTGIERYEGMLGFDWVTHKSDPQPADADMDVHRAPAPPAVGDQRDRFDLVEGLSGRTFDDILRGDDRVAADSWSATSCDADAHRRGRPDSAGAAAGRRDLVHRRQHPPRRRRVAT